MTSYERFEAWQVCHKLALTIYRVTRRFPGDERFGLTSQLRRAGYSAAANIAEGSARRGRAEFRRFLDISLGSLAEISYALRLAHDLEYLTDVQWTELEAIRVSASRLTYRLAESMRR